jgi:outer membrane protein OmpA-like peptidoglycan-associated protein
MVYRRAVAILFALFVIPSVSSAAPSPRAEIEAFFERAKGILSEATDVTQARAEFRQLTHRLFDGRAATRQVLGPEWDKRPPATREEFARVFGDVFERAYLEIVQGQLPRHRMPSIRVIGEDVTGGRQAVVRTSVTAKDGHDVRMDYAMARTGERWRVHDVVIGGVSLVENYRAQFARVLQTASYFELLERLRTAAGTDAPSLAAVDADAPAEVVVYFGANRAELGEGGRRELDKVAPKLAAANGQARVLVEGHADRRGDFRSNDTLAERRALAIREHLVGSGVEAARIAIVNHGARRPVCQEPTESCWALNRRASVRLAP